MGTYNYSPTWFNIINHVFVQYLHVAQKSSANNPGSGNYKAMLFSPGVRDKNNDWVFLKNTIDWSKDQFENWHIKNKSVVVKEIIDTNIVLSGSLIKSKNIKINSLVSNEFKIETDESILLIILRNLIYNAIKHSPDYLEVEILVKDGV